MAPVTGFGPITKRQGGSRNGRHFKNTVCLKLLITTFQKGVGIGTYLPQFGIAV